MGNLVDNPAVDSSAIGAGIDPGIINGVSLASPPEQAYDSGLHRPRPGRVDIVA